MPMPTCIQLCIPSLIKGHRWRNQWLFTSPHDHDEQTHLKMHPSNKHRELQLWLVISFPNHWLWTTSMEENYALSCTTESIFDQICYITCTLLSIDEDDELTSEEWLPSHIKPLPHMGWTIRCHLHQSLQSCPTWHIHQKSSYWIPPRNQSTLKNSCRWIKFYVTWSTNVFKPSREQTPNLAFNNWEAQVPTSLTTNTSTNEWGSTSKLQLVQIQHHQVVPSLLWILLQSIEQQLLTGTKHLVGREDIQQVPQEQCNLPQVHNAQIHATPIKSMEQIWHHQKTSNHQSHCVPQPKTPGLRKHQQEPRGMPHLGTLQLKPNR